MVETILQDETGFVWIEVTDPSEPELEELREKYRLHPTSVRDCLNPIHLPKFEMIDTAAFLIVRYVDPAGYQEMDSDTIRELTRKIACFVGEKYLITVHRKPESFLTELGTYWKSHLKKGLDSRAAILIAVLRRAFLSYEAPLAMAEDIFEAFENRVLEQALDRHLIEELYFLKRKSSVYRRMLRQNLDVVYHLGEILKKKSPYLQDLTEEGARILQHAEEMIEDVNNLLNTHISLASHRTNEIMRILTLFSVFFMPLTFIVGVYGMNFQHMPELKSPFGYPAVLVLMVAVSAAIYLWFRKRRWL